MSRVSLHRLPSNPHRMGVSAGRVTADDLEYAAGWLLAYEGESGKPIECQPPEDDDEQQQVLRRVAAWIDAEVARRRRDALVRETAQAIAERTGHVATDARVVAAARRHVAWALEPREAQP